MLKLKTLFSILLLIISTNTYAFCVQNNTMKSIYFRSDILTKDIEVTPNKNYCTKTLENVTNFAIFLFNTDEMFMVCTSIHSGVKNNIVVVPSGDHATCIAY